MKFTHFAKILIAAVLGFVIALLFTKNPQILVFVFGTILIFIYFELAEQKPKEKGESKFAKEMKKFKNKL